jgi:hypothetical protein
MSHQKEGKAGPLFPDKPVYRVNIRADQISPPRVGAVPPKPPLAGIVQLGVRGIPVAPQILRPYLNAFRTEFSGEPFVTERMFRHSVNYMQDRPRFSTKGSPMPQKKPGASFNRYPAGGIGPDIDHIHGEIVASLLIFGYRARFNLPLYAIVLN